MINERDSDRINFLPFYVSLAWGSTCSLAATRYLEICHRSWSRASAGLKGFLHQAMQKDALLPVMVAERVGGARTQSAGPTRHSSWLTAITWKSHTKAHVKFTVSALLLLVCIHTHPPLLITAARIEWLRKLIHTAAPWRGTLFCH